MNNPILLTGTTPYNVMFGREANYNLTPAKEITSSDDLSKHSSDVDESSEVKVKPVHYSLKLTCIISIGN